MCLRPLGRRGERAEFLQRLWRVAGKPAARRLFLGMLSVRVGCRLTIGLLMAVVVLLCVLRRILRLMLNWRRVVLLRIRIGLRWRRPMRLRCRRMLAGMKCRINVERMAPSSLLSRLGLRRLLVRVRRIRLRRDSARVSVVTVRPRHRVSFFVNPTVSPRQPSR